MNQRLTKLFLIGSYVSIFPFIYLGYSYNKLSCEQTKKLKIKYATLVTLIPLIYGIVYTVLTLILEKYIKNHRTRLFILGAIAGELYSLMGHYLIRIPETLFKSKNPNMVHVYAPVLYSLIYGVIVYELEKKVL